MKIFEGPLFDLLTQVAITTISQVVKDDEGRISVANLLVPCSNCKLASVKI